ncbi:MAG: hypothetical protein H0V05_00655 [Euzebyaceae bacterium]|nr:hypothetical protein [Euzebyaceae bacterium]
MHIDQMLGHIDAYVAGDYAVLHSDAVSGRLDGRHPGGPLRAEDSEAALEDGRVVLGTARSIWAQLAPGGAGGDGD